MGEAQFLSGTMVDTCRHFFGDFPKETTGVANAVGKTIMGAGKKEGRSAAADLLGELLEQFILWGARGCR